MFAVGAAHGRLFDDAGLAGRVVLLRTCTGARADNSAL